MNRFSQEARQRTQVLRDTIQALPFNLEFADGTSARERFRHYITQDALYLGQYARTLAMARRARSRYATLQAFAQSGSRRGRGRAGTARALLLAFGVDPAPLGDSPNPHRIASATPTSCWATANHEPWEVLVAALLPCFWIYWDVGSAIAENGGAGQSLSRLDRHLCRSGVWRGGAAVIATADRAAEGCERTDCVRKCSPPSSEPTQYEWLFWDGAYHRRGWPKC